MGGMVIGRREEYQCGETAVDITRGWGEQLKHHVCERVGMRTLTGQTPCSGHWSLSVSRGGELEGATETDMAQSPNSSNTVTPCVYSVHTYNVFFWQHM